MCLFVRRKYTNISQNKNIFHLFKEKCVSLKHFNEKFTFFVACCVYNIMPNYYFCQIFPKWHLKSSISICE